MMFKVAYLITCDYCNHQFIMNSKPKGVQSLKPTMCPNCGQVGGSCEKYEVVE